MILRKEREPRALLATALALAVAVLAGALLTVSPLQAAEPGESAAVRALELQGFLAGDGDAHFLGLEPAQGAPSIVLTLVYRTPDDALVRDGVNFTVLSEQGMQAYLTGTLLADVALAQGETLRAGPDGTIVQASLRAEGPGGYTVIVSNSWHTPTRYMLTVHGATLVDEGGQTLLRVPVHPDTAPLPDVGESFAPPAQNADQPAQTIPVVARETLNVGTPPAHARSMSGSLHPLGDRREFALRPAADGEISVRLSYRVDGGFVPNGVINFWVLTQDGLRHVNQGALLAELNLAAGRPDANGAPGKMTATVRLGAQDIYAIIVFNESAVPADFALEVNGASLMAYDEYERIAGLPGEAAAMQADQGTQAGQDAIAVAHP